MRMQLIVSLHDVTPFHLDRLVKAEALCRDLGVQKLTYLLVPRYHGGYACDEEEDFVAWCRAPREFGVAWHLHGYHHLDDASGTDASWTAAFRRRLTGGEGEFRGLDPVSQRCRLAAGREAFYRCLGCDPETFVAPAWMFGGELLPLLREFGFRYTEDHWRLYDLAGGRGLRSPVFAWATRTVWRKYASVAFTPLLSILWRREPVLRVAIHPFDLDHRQTTDSIRKVLARLLEGREQCFCEEIDFAMATRSRQVAH
jgi:uncharacterized protein